MKNKKLFYSLIGLGSLVATKASAQSTSPVQGQAVVASYDSQSHVAVIRDVNNGNTIETLPRTGLEVGDLVTYVTTANGGNVGTGVKAIVTKLTAFWHS